MEEEARNKGLIDFDSDIVSSDRRITIIRIDMLIIRKSEEVRQEEERQEEVCHEVRALKKKKTEKEMKQREIYDYGIRGRY